MQSCCAPVECLAQPVLSIGGGSCRVDRKCLQQRDLADACCRPTDSTRLWSPSLSSSTTPLKCLTSRLDTGSLPPVRKGIFISTALRTGACLDLRTFSSIAVLYLVTTATGGIQFQPAERIIGLGSSRCNSQIILVQLGNGRQLLSINCWVERLNLCRFVSFGGGGGRWRRTIIAGEERALVIYRILGAQKKEKNRESSKGQNFSSSV